MNTMPLFVLHDNTSALAPLLDSAAIAHGARLPRAGAAPRTVANWRADGRMLSGYGGAVLNAPGCGALLADQPLLKRVLRLYGVRCDDEADGDAPTGGAAAPWTAAPSAAAWTVPVFQTKALGVFRQHDGRRETDWREARLRRLERYAARALYASGLDYGCVTVRLAGGLPAVTRIEPYPALDGERAVLFAAALAEYADAVSGGGESEGGPAIMLGMDPEFVLRSGEGKLVPASRYLPYAGVAGYDSATLRGRKGVHPLAELRPEPSGEPDGLVRNLRRAMWAAAARIADPSLQWLAGGMPVPGLALGGHVHISGVYASRALLRALDHYLALPLVLLEAQSTGARRKKYGFPGDIRHQAHGGFEYRTLPSWIVSPSLTKGVVALAKLVAERHGKLPCTLLDDPAVLEAYAAGDKETLRPLVAGLWRQLEQTEGYAAYARYIDPLSRWIKEGRVWDEQRDIRVHWRIPPFA